MIWPFLFKVAGSALAAMFMALLLEEMDVNPTATDLADKGARFLLYGAMFLIALGAIAWMWGL